MCSVFKIQVTKVIVLAESTTNKIIVFFLAGLIAALVCAYVIYFFPKPLAYRYRAKVELVKDFVYMVHCCVLCGY